jgi:hypothetical protein
MLSPVASSSVAAGAELAIELKEKEIIRAVTSRRLKGALMLILCAFITPPEIAKKLQVSKRSRGFQVTKYKIKSQLLFVGIIGTIPHSGSIEG